MRLHTVAYSESLGAVTNSDVNAANDDVLGTRNSHLILTEPYDVLAVYGSSSTLTRARFGNATLQQKAIPHLWPLGRSDTIPSRPPIMDRRHMPIMLPQDEEITIEATTDAAGPVIANFIMWLAAEGWSQNIPRGLDRFTVRATAVIVAGAASQWTALANLVMERDLIQGSYAVVGAEVVAANAIAYRIRFPDQVAVNNKQLRPGGLVQNALGDIPWEAQSGQLGEWGRFHTFTLPQLQVFDDTAGGTYEVRLDLVYLGSTREALMTAA